MKIFAGLAVFLALGLAACGDASGASAAEDANGETESTAATESVTADAADLPDLDDFLNFADPRTCEYSESFTSAMATVFEMNDDPNAAPIAGPGSVTIPGIAEPVPTQMARPYADEGSPEVIEYQLDFEGRWLGLHVVGYEDAMIEESCCIWASGIRFDEPVERVTEALIEAGYPVNADGSERETPMEDAARAVTEVRENDGVTVFYCNQVFEY
ncbi:MAG: hypothetical protein ACTS1Z_02575 [Parasphingopyxis sp.]|uniref:hypothetical protein n=1 Tax=Parasphingopyxis sp. TaxID=1920299 RepID=UPI003FA02B5C